MASTVRHGTGAAMGLAMALAHLGCTPPVNPAGDLLNGTSTGEAFSGVQCSAVRPQTEPDLMAWDPGSRSNLNRLRRQGVVAVRYQAKGCNVELELLSNCIGTSGKYEFSPYSANEHKVAHNVSELFAQLPVGAARLSGTVKGTRALRTDYMMAGQYALPAGSTFKAADLRGPDCARATHVISAVYVGAFAMGAGESRALEGGVTLLGAGGGTRSAADVDVLSNEGDAEACTTSQKESKENVRCAVPLRIGLIALDAALAPLPPVMAAAPSNAPAPPLGATGTTTGPSAFVCNGGAGPVASGFWRPCFESMASCEEQQTKNAAYSGKPKADKAECVPQSSAFCFGSTQCAPSLLECEDWRKAFWTQGGSLSSCRPFLSWGAAWRARQ